MRSMILVSVTLATFFVSCASDPAPRPNETATQPKNYKAEAGPYAVGAIPDAMIIDSQRKKDLALSIEYPTSAGPHPVIIFSHGFGGSNRGYVGLSSFWASYGYVVIKPTHADSGVGGTLREAPELIASQTPAEWKNRVSDITAIIDAMPAIEAKYPELKGKMDASRVGVGGHSYGAFTAMVTGGADIFRGGRIHLADARVKAIVAMSPQGPSERFGLTEQSYLTLAVPTLFMTGTRDRGAEGEDATWRRKAFELSPAGSKTLISIEGAHHFSFSGRFADEPERDLDRNNHPIDTSRDPFGRDRTTSPTNRPRDGGVFQRERAIFALIKTSSLAFWDKSLKSDSRGSEYLEELAGRSDVEYAVK